jgi:hypothetical protein
LDQDVTSGHAVASGTPLPHDRAQDVPFSGSFAHVPAGAKVHLILDNASGRKTMATDAIFPDHPRLFFADLAEAALAVTRFG